MEDLLKISTYARNENISVTWVHKLIEKKEINLIVIDGVKFIKPKK